MMIAGAEFLLWSMQFCSLDEANKRKTWAMNFMRGAPMLLALLSVNQAEHVEELQQIASITPPIQAAKMMASDADAEFPHKFMTTDKTEFITATTPGGRVLEWERTNGRR